MTMFALALVFATAGLPSYAMEASGGARARLVDIETRGESQQMVREYDGRQGDVLELDGWVSGSYGGRASLDLGLFRLNSADESGFLELRGSDWLGVDSSFGIMTHRQPYVYSGMIENNLWKRNFLITPRNYAGEPLLFKRYESVARMRLNLPDQPNYRLFFGYWQEQERGATSLAYRNNSAFLTRQNLDRFTRDYSVGVAADMADGGAAYEFTRRKTADYAAAPIDPSYTGSKNEHPNWELTWNPNLYVDKHDLTFRYPFAHSLQVAGGATGLRRSSNINGYRAETVAGNVGLSYQPVRDMSMSARLYQRMTVNRENTGFAAWQSAELPLIDFNQYKGDFRIRYGLRRATLSAAYKSEYTRRRHTDMAVERFTRSATYQDGVFHPAEFATNDVQREDIKHRVELEADIELPYHADLGLAYKLLKANRSVFENSPTIGHTGSAKVEVPLREAVIHAGYEGLYEKAQDSAYSNFRQRLDRLTAGADLSLLQGRASAGTFYAYERGRRYIDAWFGSTNVTYLGTTVTNLIHEPNSLYEYRNHVLNAHAMGQLPLKLTADADLTYTRSRADWMVTQIDEFFTGSEAGKFLTNFNPTRIDIVRWGLGLAYEIRSDISARVSYYQDAWFDRFDDTLSGRASFTQLAINARF
ncbi:MAG: hypothetical protein HY549_06925 [Elusimicrobia bacterium]|nr:hypothetical protein [Elusimicrobiota bacterium]